MSVVIGDGDSCDVLHNCDINAQCVFDRDLQSFTCRCDPGYTGKLVFCCFHFPVNTIYLEPGNASSILTFSFVEKIRTISRDRFMTMWVFDFIAASLDT